MQRYLLILLMLSSLFLTQLAYANNLPDFTPLVDQNSAAVVNISTSNKARRIEGMPPGLNMPDIPENSPFYEFFKKYFGDIPKGEGPSQERSSLGSGFIISKDGYVITNHHVIRDADEVIVRLSDRREFIASVIGTDERSDIAVLKIDADELPILKLGNVDNLKVGEWVLAIGSPFGFDHSVTAGIISAIGRSLPNENYVPFIQTDVAINPGNSGGPLFNLDGEVIGVNSQIYSRTGGFMGLSFAVPVDVVESVYQQLRDKGRVSRGWLGVLIQDVTRELAESFEMDYPHGALIAKILENGPAEKSGIKVGDIIVEYDGKKINFSSDLPPLVGSTLINTEVPVKIIRRGKVNKLTIKILELPSDEQVIAQGEQVGAKSNVLNLVVSNLNKEQKEDLELTDHGVLIDKVGEGPAQSAGIKSGDILLLLNNEKVKDSKHFQELISDLPRGKSIPVLIQRRGGPIFLALKIDE